MKLKRFLSIIMALSMTTAVFTPVYASEEKEKLTLWDFHNGSEAESVQEMVDEYNQSQDKVEIEYSSVNQTDYTTTLVTTAYANGECPDILWVEPATYKKFTEAGMLADLSSYYTDDLKKDILPSYLEAATGDDGKIYTLPFECETLGLFYDADVLKEEGIEPPTTWEELKSAAEKLTTDDRYGIVLPVEKTAYLRVRSRKRYLELIKRRKKLMKRYKTQGKQIAEQYRKASETLKGEKFWKEYLGM